MKQISKVSTGVLFADFYQFTMAQLYFDAGIHTQKVQFEYFFRNYPDYGKHQAGYCINAGLEWVIEWLKNAVFDEGAVNCLRGVRNGAGQSLFREDFLKWLNNKRPLDSLSIKAVPEGRVVHPEMPLMVVQGELAMAQIIESSLLNNLNYQTLIATKTSRIRYAGQKRPVLEFGMRRAQGLGANAGTRASLIGGAEFSSNTGISFEMGYTPRGTHAHSMVQMFLAMGEGELEAFRAYAKLYPDDCLLLVDTVNTLKSGIPNAIRVFEELRRKGHKPRGIRLDSGDLAYLAVRASKMLNDADFSDVIIVLSNKIDEIVLMQIIKQIEQEAPRYGLNPESVICRLSYGVGTKLITSEGASSLDGVYKLTAVYKKNGWAPAIKLSESIEKIPIPGKKELWRMYDKMGVADHDLVGLHNEKPLLDEKVEIFHPVRNLSRVVYRNEIDCFEPLLKDVVIDGRIVYHFPTIEKMRKMRDNDLGKLDMGVKRLINPHLYHVSLSRKLWELKNSMIRKNVI